MDGRVKFKVGLNKTKKYHTGELGNLLVYQVSQFAR